MTVNFYLDSKTDKSNEKAIYCFVRGIGNRKTIYIKTGLKISPSHWNAQKQTIKKSFTEYSYWNNCLLKYKSEIQKVYTNIIAQENNPDFDFIKENILKIFDINQSAPKKQLFEIFDQFIDIRKNTLSPNTVKNYNSLKNHLNPNFPHST